MVDEIISIRQPLSAKPGNLRITESYLCLEGEGLTLGALTWLIRLSGCDLRCYWCDTRHASFDESLAREIPWQKVRDQALSSGAAWASLTGGEPCFRGEAEMASLAKLCRALKTGGMMIKLETNGLAAPKSLVPLIDLWTVSPKWDSRRKGKAQLTPLMRYDPGVLRRTLKAFPLGGLQFKFVVTFGPGGRPRESDFSRVEALLKQAPGLKSRPLVLVPEGTAGPQAYLERCRRLNEAVCLRASRRWKGLDLRVMPQWHKVLYGNETKR